MPAAMRVRAGMAIGRVIAAADLAALQADAQMQPRFAAGQAVLAALDRLGQLHEANAVEMGARGHLGDSLDGHRGDQGSIARCFRVGLEAGATGRLRLLSLGDWELMLAKVTRYHRATKARLRTPGGQ
jgi:hypothetical protein